MPRHELADTRRPYGAGVWIAVCVCGEESGGRRKKKSAVHDINRHIEREAEPPPQKCPNPNKAKFRTEETANTVLGRTWIKPRPGEQLSAHAYLCRCGYWHLTKRDQT